MQFRNQLMESMKAVNSELASLFHQFYQPYGLTQVQAAVLFELHTGGSRNMSELCQNLHMTNSNVSAICKRLERADLIERRRDAADERVVLVYLTDRAHLLLRKVIDEVEGKYRAVFGMVPEEEQLIVLNGLNILRGWLSQVRREWD